MNAIGTNTATIANVVAITASPIRRSPAPLPDGSCLEMAHDVLAHDDPIRRSEADAGDSAISVIMLRVKPKA
jgi:hypothetical protein